LHSRVSGSDSTIRGDACSSGSLHRTERIVAARADGELARRRDGGGGGRAWRLRVRRVAPGETRTGVEWLIKIDGGSISLDEDMRNWPTDDTPYKGSATGQQFTATHDQGPHYLDYVCQFRGGTLTGSFNADFSTFEATEILVWGPPENDLKVQRHWVASRL
jgi:hypothetical protein